MFMVQTYF